MLNPSRRGVTAGAIALFAAASAARAASAAGEPTVSPTWDLTDLYPSDAAWQAEYDRLSGELPKLKALKGTLGQSAQSLKNGLQYMSDINKATARLDVYANLKGDLDTRNNADLARRGVLQTLETQIGEATAWVSPEILTIGQAKITAYEAAEPGLAKFRFPLELILRAGPHTLSDEGEGILAAAGQPLASPVSIYTQLTDSDIPWPSLTLSTGETVKLDDSGYGLYRALPNRDDRKKVMTTFFGAYKTFESSIGATLAAQVNGDIFVARARHFDGAMQASVFGNGIEESVYRTLIAECNAGLPQLHRYFKLRQKLLNLPDIAYWDIYPPVVKLDRKFDLATKRKLVLEAVKPLGEAYGATLAKATASKWMDSDPRPGKVGGAYMNGAAYDVHPYLLLNLYDNYEGLTTFAHEWGHAMHTMLANAAQPYELAEYQIFLAEIASTNNEQLLAHYMAEKATTKAEKLFYLDQLLELFRATFYRQTLFAEFELAAHEEAEKGGAVTGARLTEIYYGLMRKYHGPDMIIDPSFGVEWAYVPHFYRDFYVYQYATSIAASAFFSDRTLAGGVKERESYLNVLRAGASDYPNAILKRSGLDMTSPEPYRALVAKFARTLDQVEALIA